VKEKEDEDERQEDEAKEVEVVAAMDHVSNKSLSTAGSESVVMTPSKEPIINYM